MSNSDLRRAPAAPPAWPLPMPMLPLAPSASADAWSWLFDGLRLLRLRFHVEPAAPMRLATWPGSAFRGAVGHVLARRWPDAYARLHRPTGPRGSADLPVRVIPQWAPGRSGWIEPGETYAIDMLLVGADDEDAIRLAAAMDEAACTGMGRGGVAHRMQLIQAFPRTERSAPLRWFLPPPPDGCHDRLALRLLTPLRIHADPRVARDLHVSVLIEGLARRAALLARSAGCQPDEGLLAATVAHARGSVEVEQRTVTWVPLERRSSRQGRRLDVAGLVGRVVLRGTLEPILPLLQFALVLHAGRHVSVGHGRLALEPRRGP